MLQRMCVCVCLSLVLIRLGCSCILSLMEFVCVFVVCIPVTTHS